MYILLLLSQEQSHCYPSGLGQSGEQLVCQVQQCRAEEHPQLETVC